MYIDYKNRIFGLDVVRALAIMMVLVSHSTWLLFPNESNVLLTITRSFGAIGVDLFFVLSGYLIGTIILKQVTEERTRLTDFFYFWIRRWFRTLPNYFLILLLNILLGFAIYNVIIDDIGSYFIFLQNFSSPHPDFFTEAWSLSIEEYAYVIGPLLLFLLIKTFKNSNSSKLYLVVVLSIIFLVTLFRIYHHSSNLLYHDYNWSKALRKVVIYRLDCIYYGFIAAFLGIAYTRIWRDYKKLFFCLGILIFFGVHTLIFIYEMQPDDALIFFDVFYLPIVSVSLLLLFPLFSNWSSGTFFKNQITSISVLSYALYLVNYSLVLLSIQHFIDVANQSVLIKGLIFLMYWILSFLLAYLLYKYFERPMTDLRNSRLIKDRFIK